MRAFLDSLPRQQQQQYVDFLTNCASHGALLCHHGVQILYRPDASVLRDCWIGMATNARRNVVQEPLLDTALSRLQERRPEFVAFNDPDQGAGTAACRLMDAYAAGSVDLTLSPPALANRISDRPMVSPLVRLQARDGAVPPEAAIPPGPIQSQE